MPQQYLFSVPDPIWVSQPSPPNYGGHNGGIALDLTLEESSSGKELDMGSSFDEFSEASNYGAAGLTSEQESNRAMLREVMKSSGFNPYDGEWWHFSLPISAEPLDLAL